MLERYTKTVVGMPKLSVNLHYFDVEIHEEGIAGFFMWRTTQHRSWFSKFTDMMKRNGRKVNLEDINGSDDYSFFIPWSDIQGIVTYDHHREIMIRTKDNLYSFLFRMERIGFHVLKKNLNFYVKDNYFKMIKQLKSRTEISEKMFSRDNVKIRESVYEGYPENTPNLVPQYR